MATLTHLKHFDLIPRLFFLFIAGSALVFVPTATAEAAVYEGHFKGLPGTQFDLTINKTSGKRRVERLDYDGMPVNCENGPAAHNGFNNYSSGNRVRGGEFNIRTDAPGFFTHLVGKLKRGGKAVGTYRSRVDFGPPQGTCRTGELEWVAQKP